MHNKNKKTQPRLNFLQALATKSHSKYLILEVFLLNQNLAVYVESPKFPETGLSNIQLL